MSEPKFFKREEFDRIFSLALKDATFRKDIKRRGLAALESRGFELKVPNVTREILDKTLLPTGSTVGVSCSVCGVCGLCGLCGEANAASAVAALAAVTNLDTARRPGSLGLPPRPNVDINFPPR